MNLSKLKFIPIGVTLLVLINLFAFYILTGGMLGASDTAPNYALRYTAPLSYFTYSFVHLWPMHLFANLIFLLVFGYIIESKVGFQRFLLFYFISAISTGLISQALDLFATGNIILIAGASGAVFALLGAAVAVRPAESVALYCVLAFLVIPAVLSSGVTQVQRGAIQKAQQFQQEADLQIEVVREQYESGIITEEEREETTSQILEKREQATAEIKSIKIAQRREKTTEISESTHTSGMLIGLFLILLLAPELLAEWEHRTEKIIYFIEKSRRKLFKARKSHPI